MAIKTIQIPEDVVNDIQEKDAKIRAIEGVLARAFDNDYASKVAATGSPSVVENAMLDRLTKAHVDFENAKNAMVLKYLSAEISNIKNWTLDYGTKKLSYEV